MRSVYPDRVALRDLLRSMSARSARSIRNQLARLRTDKLIIGDNKEGYRLTRAGHVDATKIVRAVLY
jgi:predicted transcriptional regulator